jgi:hypothetical protein
MKTMKYEFEIDPALIIALAIFVAVIAGSLLKGVLSAG